MNFELLAQILILLATSVLVVTVLRRLGLPPVLGYFAVGFALGPHLLGFVEDTRGTRLIAEFGVVFLLFTLGLSFSFPKLMAMRRVVLGLGSAQVLATTLLAASLATAMGWSPGIALLLGGAAAMSSTAIVIRELEFSGAINQPEGNLAVGVLLLQDLAVVPFLVLIPFMAGSADPVTAQGVLLAIAEGFAALAAVLLTGHYLLRPLFREIARSGIGELFTMAALLVALGAAWLTHAVGLSYALGGFLAGILLGETEYRHQVAADIRPFRDLLLGLFFITVGMLLDWRVLAANIVIITLLVLGLLVAKAVIIAALARMTGVASREAWQTGFILAQGGEFGIALVTLGLQAALLPSSLSQSVLAALVISMTLAPMLIKYSGSIAAFLTGRKTKDAPLDIAEPDPGTARVAGHEHVIICGYGRVGQNLGRALEEENIEFIALDLDPFRVRAARDAGDPVIYGSAARPDILRAAGIYHASAVVITFKDYRSVIQTLSLIRHGRPSVPILVRSTDDTHLNTYYEAGATEVVPETLEASLMVMSHLLFVLRVPVRRIVEKVKDARERRYRSLRKIFRKEFARTLGPEHALREQLNTVILPAGASAVGHHIKDLNLDRCNVQVTALRRKGIVGNQPIAETILHEGDALVLYGTPEDLERGEEILMQG